jgi:hypothetical protein
MQATFVADGVEALADLHPLGMTKRAAHQIGGVSVQRGDLHRCQADVQINRRAFDVSEWLMDRLGDERSVEERAARCQRQPQDSRDERAPQRNDEQRAKARAASDDDFQADQNQDEGPKAPRDFPKR